MTGFMSPKVDKTATLLAEKKAAEEEARAQAIEKQKNIDDEYRRTKQVGRASTVFSIPQASAGRTLLGG